MFKNRFIKTICLLVMMLMLMCHLVHANDVIYDTSSGADVSVFAQPKKLFYNKYTFGASADDDEVFGNMSIVIDFFGNEEELYEITPSEENHNCSHMVDTRQDDRCTARKNIGGKDCIFTTRFYRPARPALPVATGCVYFSMGTDVTASDKTFTIEVEYFDNSETNILLRYVNGRTTGNFGSVYIPRTNTNTWKRATVTINDACFNSGVSTALADNNADFLIGCENEDTYIKSVSIYSSERGSELIEIADNLALGVEDSTNIEASFMLPEADGADIEWTSSDSSIVTIDDNIAIINPKMVPQSAVLTAKIIKDGYYLTKDFPVTLAKFEKTAIIISEPELSKDGDKHSVAFSIEKAFNVPGRINLFAAAFDKTSGKLSDIGKDFFDITSHSYVSLLAEVTLKADDEFKYFLATENGAPLTNRAPADVKKLTAKRATKSVTLNWNAAKDDWDMVTKYIISKNGEDVLETEYLSGVVDGLGYGETNTFSVRAVDHMGEQSSPVSISVTQPTPAYINLGNIKDASNISFLLGDDINGGDYYSESAEKDGIPCRKTVNRGPINGRSASYLYFDVDESIVSYSDNNVTFEITYFDEGTGNLMLQYNAMDGTDAKNCTVTKLTDTKQWKTATVTVNDAQFRAPAAFSYRDFRIFCSGDTNEIYVFEVAVMPAGLLSDN